MPLNQLARDVSTPPDCKLRRAFCVWSDLLGFGRPFSDNGWNPDAEVWRQQAIRAGNAYRAQCRFMPGLDGSYMLLLNDGMVRALPWSEPLGPADLGLWLRAAIQGHFEVRRAEFDKGLPGPRTVLSSGWTAEHSFSEVRMDDLVFDYTRQQPGLSKLAEATGNPVLVSNPVQLQLNTAFSRAFLLDEGGKLAGLPGPCVYIDSQFLDDVTALFKDRDDFRVSRWTRENDIVYAVEHREPPRQSSPIVPSEVLTKDAWNARCAEEARLAAERGYLELPQGSGRDPWAFGFLLEKTAIEVNLPNLRTIVYRALGFFPHDEDPSEFMFELWPV